MVNFDFYPLIHAQLLDFTVNDWEIQSSVLQAATENNLKKC